MAALRYAARRLGGSLLQRTQAAVASPAVPEGQRGLFLPRLYSTEVCISPAIFKESRTRFSNSPLPFLSDGVLPGQSTAMRRFSTAPPLPSSSGLVDGEAPPLPSSPGSVNGEVPPPPPPPGLEADPPAVVTLLEWLEVKGMYGKQPKGDQQQEAVYLDLYQVKLSGDLFPRGNPLRIKVDMLMMVKQKFTPPTPAELDGVEAAMAAARRAERRRDPEKRRPDQKEK